ncbi:unnamed protein product [Effrenium voratum]|nr:unnamed protein product [Effrenium voratum]
MAIAVDVVLLSGQTATIFADQQSTVQQLRQKAQQELQVQLLDLFLHHRQLYAWLTLHGAGLEHRSVVNANVWQPQLFCSARSTACAVVYADAVLWGDPLGELQRLDLKEVRAVVMSSGAYAALLADGQVAAWGDFLGGGHLGAARSQLRQVRQIVASHRAFAAVRADGAVVAWGDVAFGGDLDDLEPTDVVRLCASRRAFAALKADGTVVTWGDSDFGGDSSAVQTQLVSVAALAATESAFLALRADGALVAWGGGFEGELAPAGGAACALCATRGAFGALLQGGAVAAWGDPDLGGRAPVVQGAVELSATAGAFAALLEGGGVATWGHGALGGVQKIESTFGAFAALRADGKVIVWGDAYAGADGEGAEGAFGCRQLQGAEGAFAALGADGALVAWGRGAAGKSLSDYVTSLGPEEALLLSSSLSLEAQKAIETQITRLFGEPHELWERLQELGTVGSQDLERLRCAITEGKASCAMGPRQAAVQDADGIWSYQELWDISGRIAGELSRHGLVPGRPVAVFLRPGRLWYACCLACWRLAVPVLALSADRDSDAEARRAQEAAAALRPAALVFGDNAFEIQSLPSDCLRLPAEQLLNAQAKAPHEVPDAAEAVLAYVFTGGTTRHSKCVAVTHRMALWEIEQYPKVLGSLGNEKMLQHSSAYWGAAIFGQVDLALAFGACNVICLCRRPEEIAAACADFGITVLGVVPSQLRGAYPAGPQSRARSLRRLITWAERTPLRLAAEWKAELPVVELLIASERLGRHLLREDLEQRKAREASWQRKLRRVQRWMLRLYGACHGLVLALVLLASVLQGGFAKRLLLLPFLWVAWLYAWQLAGRPVHRWVSFSSPLGPVDVFLLLALLTPGSLLLPELLLSLSVLCLLRDRDVLAGLGFGALALAQLAQSPRLYLMVLPGLFGHYWFWPSRMHFLLSLPLVYLLSFPKWFRDAQTWRAHWAEARLRHLVLRLLPEPGFDGHLHFEKNQVAYDWGSKERWVNVCMSRAEQNNLLKVNLWEPVRPAAVPRGASGGDGREEFSAEEAPLAALVERAGGCPRHLNLDSLQAIRLVELARRELNLSLTAQLVLQSRSLRDLLDAELEVRVEEPLEGGPDEEGAFRLYVMEYAKSPVDWFIRFGHGLDLAALQRACDRLVARHSTLRARPHPDEAMRETMDRAAAMWQVACSAWPRLAKPLRRFAAAQLAAAWPRTFLATPEEARKEVLIVDEDVVRDPGFASMSDDKYMFWLAKSLRSRHRWPWHVFAVPVVRADAGPRLARLAGRPDLRQALRQLPPEDVVWYIYVGITHAYSDGASGHALLQDLLRLYGEELGPAPAASLAAPLADPMALLQRRLEASLRGRLPDEEVRPNDEVYHESLDEDWGRRPGCSKKVCFDQLVFDALQVAGRVLGCGADVAWLTAIVGAMLRMFPSEKRIQLTLKCACRDGPGQNDMVGFLSEQRVFFVDCGDSTKATLMDVAMSIDRHRKTRSWRAPLPYEASLCVYVNIVGAITGGLPLGCHQVCHSCTGSSGSPDAYAHLNLRLDQRTALEWDFRIFHWDQAWGWQWCDYFAPVVAAVICDMAECPTAALVPAPAPAWRILSSQASPAPESAETDAGVKRKETRARSASPKSRRIGPEKRVDSAPVTVSQLRHLALEGLALGFLLGGLEADAPDLTSPGERVMVLGAHSWGFLGGVKG